MNGAEFLAKAVDNQQSYPIVPGPEMLDGIAQSYDQTMTHMLQLLYTGREIHALTDPLPPMATVVAEQYLATQDLSEGVVTRSFRYALIKSNPGNSLDKLTALAINDQTAELDQAILSNEIEQDAGILHARSIVLSNRLLANTLRKISINGTRIEAGKETIADNVVRSLKQCDYLVRESIDEYALDIAVKQAFVDDEPLHELTVSARPWTSQLVSPKWLGEHKDWDQPLHKLCSTLNELDAFVALYEWILSRKLPLIPIVPPQIIEQGAATLHFNSDILLCDLTKNSLIPIQVKNKLSSFTRQQYAEDMVLVSPQILGLTELGTEPRRARDGHIRTARTVTTRYGTLLCNFMRQHDGTKRKTPDHNYEQAFAYFDQEILPRL